MKTERRHELQTNWLADRVGDAILVTKPYMKAVTGVLLAAVVVWGAYLVISYRAEAEEANGWNKLWDGLLSGPTGREDIQSLSESSPKRQTGEWAQLILADDALTNGVGTLFTQKEQARQLINSALVGYQTVLKNSTDALVREHAWYGVGRAEESLCKIPEAEKAYNQLRTEYPDGSYFLRAKQRLDDLARPSTRERYDWFARIEPAPNVFGKGPTGDTGMKLPAELEPFSKFTPPPSKTPPPEPKPDNGAKEEPKESKPGDKTDKAKPTDSKPTDTKPTDTKPTDTKPTDTKPTDTKPTDTKPTDTKPTDTKPTDTKRTDTKAGDTKPTLSTPATEPKPDDSKAAAPKPADSK